MRRLKPSKQGWLQKVFSQKDVINNEKTFSLTAMLKSIRNLMCAMLCPKPDICYAIGMVSRYQTNPGPLLCVAVKHVLTYLRRTRDYIFVYYSKDLRATG
jgi:hypothetical protein